MRCLGDAEDFFGPDDDDDDDEDQKKTLAVSIAARFYKARPRSKLVIIATGDLSARREDAFKALGRDTRLLVGLGRGPCVVPDLANRWLSPDVTVAAIPTPPPFFRRATDRLPVAVRRILVPGLRFGWYQRQLARIARGSPCDPAQGHLMYLLFINPRNLFFDPARSVSWLVRCFHRNVMKSRPRILMCTGCVSVAFMGSVLTLAVVASNIGGGGGFWVPNSLQKDVSSSWRCLYSIWRSPGGT